jgi:hypothetical protein
MNITYISSRSSPLLSVFPLLRFLFLFLFLFLFFILPPPSLPLLLLLLPPLLL